MPTISVIIPAYNAAAFLERCLGSLRDQTFRDWEAVCVDDGSTDGTPALLDALAAGDRRIRVIHKVNEGVSAARNTGVSQAEGRYVLFLDSDDFLHPRAMEITFALAERDGSDIVCFTYDHAYRNRLLVRHLLGLPDPARMRFKSFDRFETLLTEDILSRASEYSHPGKGLYTRHCQPWRCLYRKEAIQDIRFIPGIIYEDFPWWSEVMLHPRKATLTDLPLYFYYPNSRSYILSSRREYKIRSLRTAIAAAEKVCENMDPARKQRWEEQFLRPFREKLQKKFKNA